MYTYNMYIYNMYIYNMYIYIYIYIYIYKRFNDTVLRYNIINWYRV